MRDRLIELLKGAETKLMEMLSIPLPLEECEDWLGIYADQLLANGVVVPPCYIGQKVWCIYNCTKPIEYQITILTMAKHHYSFVIETKNGVYKHYCDKEAIGKWVFFTREEAERALRKGGEQG